MGATQIHCCVERTLLEEQEAVPPDKETDVIKLKPWYGPQALPPPPRIVTSVPRTVSNATTIPT